MSTDVKKFMMINLPEFLLLTLTKPHAVFTDYDSDDGLQSVVVCYDAQHLYKNYWSVFASTSTAELVDLDDFVAYCDSKTCARFAVVDHVRYRCCMTISDLIRMNAWARLYARVGSCVIKYLLFNCLLFVPVQRDVYYCVHTPSQQAGRYEVLQSFWAMAGFRWAAITAATKNLRNRVGGSSKTKTKPATCFNIAGLLKGNRGVVKTIFRADADGEMLRDILRTNISGNDKQLITDDNKCLDALKSKLKVMAGKDSSQKYKHLYKNAIGGATFAEIPLRRIKEFATAVVCKIVPCELFGISSNRDQYCKNLCGILNCGMTQDFTVEQIIYKIKVKKMKWLDAMNMDQRIHVMTKTLVWLTNIFMFRRIAHFFQIVMTNIPSNGVAYFTKPGWATICREKISPLMNGSKFFRELRQPANDSKSTGPTMTVVTSSSYRNWKMCPYAKTNGVRLIFKLRQKDGDIDKRLTDNCLLFLRCLSHTYPAEFRSITRPQFFRGWKASQRFRDSQSSMYYVRTDFQDAFTSFKQAKLLAVVRDRIERYFGKKSQMLYAHMVDVIKFGDGNTVHCKKRKYFDGLPEPKFPVGSLVFYRETMTMPLFQIWNVIQRCIRCNVVNLGGRQLAMTRGIVQGDRLSVVLCDLLLANLQATHLNDTVGGHSSGRLYRFVDDYVFVSSNRTAARRFLLAMCSGFSEYGLELNRSKTETNLYSGRGNNRLVKFLGFRLNIVTGEVIKDETAYRNRRPLHFFDRDLGRGQPGRALYAKMTGPNRYPMPTTLISRSFNSTTTVAQNVASIVACKAHTAVAAIKQYFFHLNPVFLLRTIHAVARFIYSKACVLTRHSAVTPMQCKWIVYEVYARVLRKHYPALDGHRSVCTVVDCIRDRQFAISRKCNTRELKTALRHTRYDFTKMFD